MRLPNRTGPTRLLVSISAHGLGHLAQTAPVVRAIGQSHPGIAITVLTGIPEAAVRVRISVAFEHVGSNDDFGLLMRTPVEPLRAETANRYVELHVGWEERVTSLAGWMRAQGFGLVLSNVGYTAIAAARRAGIPAVAMSSINWVDVLQCYCGAFAGMAGVIAQIERTYRSADAFLRVVPGLPMPWLPTTDLSPIVARGRNRRDEIAKLFNLPSHTRIVVFSVSELAPPPPPAFPAALSEDLLLLGPTAWSSQLPWRCFAATGMPFLDLLTSADLVVGKPGYGLATEAAMAQVPLLLVPYEAWPEVPVHIGWLRQHGVCATTPRALEELGVDDILAALEGMRGRFAPQSPVFGGELEAANYLGRWLAAA
jgi:hypothetical protein